ncbi:toprim domain-containing protein [Rhizobium sp. ARZ01]|uniref:toprim domain-containing protein n=1 Tax=Rhizobium sp. ARZ01 TaxID=2769313 RepID=UPI001FEF4CEE|nr:toprim domain-containing protein [Rhizobium sp. ARZ01]
MSLAAIEGSREHTLYLSTGGDWSPATDAALGVLAARPGLKLVAATDSNSQGEVYADRLRAIAENVGSDWQRLRPPADDWNEALQNKEKENRERRTKREEKRAACAPVASREASPGVRRPLTRPDTRSATRKGP